MNSMVENKIDLLIRDMGRASFLKLLHFVVDILESEHEIKILMVRRFLDIFLEFEEIIQYLYGDTIQKRGIFVTNLSVVLWKDRLADKTVLVVDDIRLHGRALDKVGKFLTEQCGCKEEDITWKVFADNRDAVKIKSRFLNKTEIKERVSEKKWRRISSKIVNSFYITGQPYVSHLPYCEISFDTDEAQAVRRFVQGKDAEEITTEVQRYYQMHAYLCFMNPDSDSEQNVCLPFIEQRMVRIYIYDRLKKIVIVPYAFLKPFSYEGIVSFYQVLQNTGLIEEEELQKIRVSMKTVSGNKHLVKYLYSLETYISSLLLGKRFLTIHDIKEVSWNKEIEEYNLGFQLDVKDENMDILVKALSDTLRDGFADYTDTAIPFPPIPEIVETLEKNERIGGDQSASGFIERYMKLSGAVDERKAEKRENKRMPGIECLRLLQSLSGKTAKEVWKAVIVVIDSGRGTLTASVNMINQKFYINSLLFAGEQNSTGNESNLIYFIYPLLEYECMLHNHSQSVQIREEDIRKGKSELIHQILEYMPELCDKVNSEELKDLEEKSIREGGMDYYMERFPVYENDPKLKKILIQTKSFGKR